MSKQASERASESKQARKEAREDGTIVACFWFAFQLCLLAYEEGKRSGKRKKENKRASKQGRGRCCCLLVCFPILLVRLLVRFPSLRAASIAIESHRQKRMQYRRPAPRMSCRIEVAEEREGLERGSEQVNKLSLFASSFHGLLFSSFRSFYSRQQASTQSS
jgi:hypothetical protein